MKYFISAPFGNYIKFSGAISVTGSWTYKHRPGLLPQILKTLRYTNCGWQNKIGLGTVCFTPWKLKNILT